MTTEAWTDKLSGVGPSPRWATTRISKTTKIARASVTDEPPHEISEHEA